MGASSSTGPLSRFLRTTGMIDLGFSGNPYTWSNGRKGRGLIMERLDRGLANGEWRRLFPRATVKHLARHASDHAPLLLDTFGDSDNTPRSFRFEAFWAKDPCSVKVVEQAWNYTGTGSPAYVLCQHLKAIKAALRCWNRNVFDNLQFGVRSLQEELDDV